MTAFDLKDARDRLGLSRAELAQILGVGFSTIYRWEELPVQRMDPFHRQLCLQVLGIATHELAHVYGRALRDALKSSSTYALFVLLAIAFNEWTPSMGGPDGI